MASVDHKELIDSPRTLHIPGIKSKQVVVSILAIFCCAIMLLRHPVFVVQWQANTWLIQSKEQAVNGALVSNISTLQHNKTALLSNYSIGSYNSTVNNNTVCDYTRGKWVEDMQRRPLYSGKFCTKWLSKAWYCRLDKRYNMSMEHYRWQPHGCDMPAFDSSHFLHRMANKTIAFIGDSLGRQQYQSLLCMLAGKKTKVVDVSHLYGFTRGSGAQTFVRTNTTVLYYWSTTLAQDEPPVIPGEDSPLHLDKVPVFLRDNIHRFHVVIVNTGHHWNRGKLKMNKWITHVNGRPKRMRIDRARNTALNNCVKWLDEQTQQRRDLRVFVRTLSPRHFVGGEWNTGGRCDNIERLTDGDLKGFKGDLAAEEAVKQSRNVKVLDISYLSKSRGEAHISKMFRTDSSRQDCLHWCLPGVPDTWNELLYANLLEDK